MKVWIIKSRLDSGLDCDDWKNRVELSPQEVELLKELVQDDIFDQCCHGFDITERDKKNLLKKLEALK